VGVREQKILNTTDLANGRPMYAKLGRWRSLSASLRTRADRVLCEVIPHKPSVQTRHMFLYNAGLGPFSRASIQTHLSRDALTVTMPVM
jgi:hypothetical protein